MTKSMAVVRWGGWALLVSGCTVGQVDTPPGLGAFGGARSGVWLVHEREGAGTTHTLIVSNQRALCGTLQRALPAVEEAGARFEAAMRAAYEQGGADPYAEGTWARYATVQCEAYRAYFSELTEATDRLYQPDSRMVSLATFNGGVRVPESGEYGPPGSVGASSYEGQYIEQHRNPYAPYAEAFDAIDCQGDDLYEALYAPFYGNDTEPPSIALPLREGALTLEDVGRDRFRVQLEGALVDEVPGLSLDATVSRCDVISPAASGLELPYGMY